MTVRYVVETAGGVARDVLVAALWNAGAGGLWERGPRTLVAWFDEPVEGVPVGGVWEDEPQRDWLAEWRAGLEPVSVGGITVAPSWRVGRPTPTTLVIDPAMAFGTGHHPTTRLCLQVLQDLEVAGRSVLDLGTGTGVLAIAARRLGADRVVAMDTDPDAVAAARDNTARNEAPVDLREGSVDALRPGEHFDLVLANLVTDVVMGLAPALIDRVAPGGTLAVSGISVDRSGEVADLLAGLTGRVPAAWQEGDWVVISVGGG
jgi:ribosomal protein L11 methyltransferase